MNILDLADRGYRALPIERESTEALLAAGAVLERAVKRQLSRSGGSSRATHQPSAPGQPPAALTRELLESIRTRVIRRPRSKRGDKVRVATNLPQAPALEFGETERRIVPPHPFMRPAFDEVKSQLTSVVRAKLKVRGVRELRGKAAERASRREYEAGT